MIFLGIIILFLIHVSSLFIYSCWLHSCFSWVSSFSSYRLFPHTFHLELHEDSTRLMDVAGDTNRTFGGPSIRDPSGVDGWMIGGLDDVENVRKRCFSFWFGSNTGLVDCWIVGGGMFFYFRSPGFWTEDAGWCWVVLGWERQIRPTQGPNRVSLSRSDIWENHRVNPLLPLKKTESRVI